MRSDPRVDASQSRWALLSVLLICACAVASWNAVLIAGLQLIDLFLGAALVAAIVVLLANPELPVGRIPRWLTIGVWSVIVIVELNAITNRSVDELARGGRWLVAALVLPWLCVFAAQRHNDLGEQL